jgi:C4-dicarboxylate-specific signal transduction histidine kinase
MEINNDITDRNRANGWRKNAKSKEDLEERVADRTKDMQNANERFTF